MSTYIFNYIQGLTGNNPAIPAEERTPLHINDKRKRGRIEFTTKLAQTVLLCPFSTTARLAFRAVKLLSWAPAKAGLYKISGYHQESASYFEQQYLQTVKAVRDVLFLPSVAKQAFDGMLSTREEFVDDIPSTHDYLTVDFEKGFQQFSSYLHGLGTFEVIKPKAIQEFPSANDGALKTVMASHFLKPDMMAINFGSPNVAAFVTENKEDGSVQTVKIDAKSLYRGEMAYHATNGKIQSGIFFIPTNLPKEALIRFKEAAREMQGSRDITCVNTNCKVLEKAGFSIENLTMDKIVLPTTFMEHLLFRNVFYTDTQGKKHKIHFDILNTTSQNLEQFIEQVDTDVVGTRLRHRRRDADTEEQKQARSEEAKAIIAMEKKRLAEEAPLNLPDNMTVQRRQVTVSVPSCLGNVAAQIWGRHTIYEVNLADKKEEIIKDFGTKLQPFFQKNPSFFTRMKRDFFFSQFMIQFLRRHMMGRADVIHLYAQDLLKYLRSAPKDSRLNYVLLDDKVVLAKVHSNSNEAIKNAADWALSKHALIADRKEVHCAGEIWFDESQKCFVMNDNSGTYSPNLERVQKAAKLANEIFGAEKFNPLFKVASQNETTQAG